MDCTLEDISPEDISPSAHGSDPLVERITRLDGDERRLVEALVERIDGGRSEYGPWIAQTDQRDYGAEVMEELLDSIIYLVMGVVRRRREHQG